MNKIKQLIHAILIIVVVVAFSACEKTFDAPPGAGEVNIVANTSIQALKTYHTIPGVYDLINEDVIISGIVVANDQSGNFYKQLFIQDSTGAMQILVDANSIYTSYPVGRKVFVKCKGLTITDSYSNLVLGYKAIIDGLPSIEGIPGAMVSNHLIGGTLNNPVEPITVTVADLGTTMNNMYINALVKLDGYEFSSADTAKTYGDTSSYKSTVNRNINKGCGSNVNVVVRNSGYASFAGVKIPKGNGSITAIYTIYRSSPTSNTTTKQMLIRDENDVRFDSVRCGGNPNPNPNPGGRITIAALRALYTGTNIKLTTSASIAGVVTSDAASKNISTGSLILQDGSGAAVTIFIGGTLTYNIGDSLVFDITNDSLTNFRGSLQVKKAFGSTPPPVIATGRVVTPLVKTIAEINASIGLPLQSPQNFECSLIRVISGSATGNATYSGNNTLTDASGNIILYTATAATFAAQALPIGARTWTGHPKNYNGTTKEFLLRNPGDVQ